MARRPEKVPGGKPGVVFGKQLAEVRKRKGWTQRDLVARLADAGSPMDPASLARLENGKRGVSVDEALRIAAILGVSPTHLLFPSAVGEPVQLAPNLAVSARVARAWLRGQSPLPDSDARFYWTEVPPEDWAAMQDTSVRLLLGYVRELVEATGDDDRDAMIAAIDRINEALDRFTSAQDRRDKRGEV